MPPDSHFDKAKIIYPCQWTFAVMGKEEEAIRAAIATVLLSRPFEVRFSKKSGTAKYLSLHVETIVQNEADRDELFFGLRAHPAVKMVL
jgi:putative lipoic acid-binding regulatory protein